MYYSSTTSSLQLLLSAVSEMVSSGKLSDDDILSIRYWMDDNKHLSGNYPFDKIYSIIDDILSDGVIEPEERELLLSILLNETIYNSSQFTIRTLAGYRICLSGNFTFASRKQIENLLIKYYAINEKNVTLKTDFVFVGGLGSSEWAYGNYGNKVKKAKELQEQGHRILIFDENTLKHFFENHVPATTFTFEQCVNIINPLPDEAQKIIQKEINFIINGSSESVYTHDKITDMLIDQNILYKLDNDYASQRIIFLISYDELITCIEALNLDIPFKKNMSLEALIEWCFKNIPERIKNLFPNYMMLRLHDSFLNPDVLIKLQQHLSDKFPPKLWYY